VLLFERKSLLRYGAQVNWHYWWFKYSSSVPECASLYQPIEARFEAHELATIQAIYEKLRHRSDEARTHSTALFAGLLYGWLADWDAQQKAGIKSKAVWQTIETMHRRVDSNLTVSEMAQEACLSPRRLGQIFQEEVGLSPKQYYDNLRFERASAMLREGVCSVSEVASRLGFQDPYYFSRWFAAKSGVPPSKLIGQGNRA
jgi:AraC family transcriptional regulator of arabinose operon